MTRALGVLRATVRSLGWADGLTYLLAKLLERASRGRLRLIKYRLVVQPITDGIGLAPHRGRSIRVREVLQGDPLLQRMQHVAPAIEWRFRQGARCLAALKDQELCAYLWWIEGPYREDEVRSTFVPVPADRCVWDFDVYVYPAHRLGPAMPVLWDAATRMLYGCGFRHTCSRISAFNRPSLEAHRRLGATVVSTRLYLVAGPAQICMSGDAPRLHVSLSDRSAPRIPVEARDAMEGGRA